MAGFLLIFSTLYFGYSRLEPKTELWTIKGEVRKSEDTRHSDIDVLLLPPPKMALSKANGEFRLDRVEIDGTAELKFEIDGYISQDLLLTEENVTFDYEHKIIMLKDPVVLEEDRTEELDDVEELDDTEVVD